MQLLRQAFCFILRVFHLFGCGIRLLPLFLGDLLQGLYLCLLVR